MRRWAALVLVVALVVGARFVGHRRVAVDLALELGPRAAELRQADLIVRDAREQVVCDLHLNTPSGAAATEHRTVRLPKGQLTVGARLQYGSRPEQLVTGGLRVEEPGSYTLDLRQ